LPGCGPATAVRLERVGVRTIGDLAALPDPLLGELFGQYGRLLGAHARGIDPSPVLPPGDPKSISREVTFDRDLRDAGKVRATALGLLQDVGHSLRAHGLSARTVVLKIRYQPFDTLSRQATLPYPTDRDDQLAAALGQLLETQLDPSRAIRLIGAGVSNLEPGATQLSLLETRSSRLAMLDEQLDELRGRFGDHVIARGAAPRPHQKDVRRDDLDALR
jgi:DNA polymerase-4